MPDPRTAVVRIQGHPHDIERLARTVRDHLPLDATITLAETRATRRRQSRICLEIAFTSQPPTPFEALTLRQYCEWLAQQPRRCSYKIPSRIRADRKSRQDVIVYHSGWGWRLCRGWRRILDAREAEAEPGPGGAA
ncbi:MAG: hypothetical protein M5U01_09465 [Ardenticatenaceae bacterium]|nr:hypothetical protein [Ardenticatenaceae bacterium]